MATQSAHTQNSTFWLKKKSKKSFDRKLSLKKNMALEKDKTKQKKVDIGNRGQDSKHSPLHSLCSELISMEVSAP